MNSFNHYSLGSVGEWLYRHVAGIDLDPRTPGYGRVVIHPRPGGGLTHARAEYDSVRGRISSSWRIENDRFDLEITVPPNTTATVYVPATDAAGVTEGVEFLREEDGTAVFVVGSGRYEFVGRVWAP